MHSSSHLTSSVTNMGPRTIPVGPVKKYFCWAPCLVAKYPSIEPCMWQNIEQQAHKVKHRLDCEETWGDNERLIKKTTLAFSLHNQQPMISSCHKQGLSYAACQDTLHRKQCLLPSLQQCTKWSIKNELGYYILKNNCTWNPRLRFEENMDVICSMQLDI